MKIVQIGPYPLDKNIIKGGIEASVYGLSFELSHKNMVFVLDIPRYSLKSDFEEVEKAITVFRFGTKIENNFGAILKIKSYFKIIKKLRPDICHIHSTGFFMLIMFLLLKLINVPTLVTIHGLAHVEKKLLWQKSHSFKNFIKYIVHSFVEFIFLSLCPVFIVDTKYVYESIKQYKKQGKIIKIPKCYILPQGVSSIFFNLPKVEKNIDLLSVGSIVARKGFLTLIDTIIEVKKVFPSIKLVILGTLTDPKYYQTLVDRIKKVNLDKNINIYPDEKFDKLLSYFEKSKVFVLHTMEESQGIVFCEAMAVGLPIVATSVGGVPNLIKNGVNGFLSPFGDFNAFSNNIIKLLSDKELISQFSKANLRNAQNYRWSNIANETIKIYETLKIH